MEPPLNAGTEAEGRFVDYPATIKSSSQNRPVKPELIA